MATVSNSKKELCSKVVAFSLAGDPYLGLLKQARLVQGARVSTSVNHQPDKGLPRGWLKRGHKDQPCSAVIYKS